MAGFHASQCGFCTPGMCTSIFSSLVTADNSNRKKPADGFSKLKVSEAENAFSGNLCRCTGYRPIVDACKSFAADVDLEDLGLNIFWKKGDKGPDASKLPSYTLGGGICIFPDFLISELKALHNKKDEANNTDPMENKYHPRLSNTLCDGICSFLDCLKFGSKALENPVDEASKEGWYRPTSVKQYYKLINFIELNESSVRVVVGNTSAGVYKDHDIYNKYVDIGGIPELSYIVKKAGGIEIGAATTISRSIEILLQESKSISSTDESVVFKKLAEHMRKVASPFVRNTASLGGNIVLAQKYQFPSDIATILLGAGATVCLHNAGELQHITLEEFLQQAPLNPTTLLISIFVPHWISKSEKETSLVFQTYRAASRPLGNAISYVNSAFLGQICFDESSGELVLSNLHLAFGAYGTEHAIRARNVEKFLTGRSLTASSVLRAVQLLREIIVPMKGTLHAEYRISVAVGFLFSFLSPLAKGMAVPRISELALSSRQETISDDEHKPIGEPTKKYGVELQASGEAVYVDDIPTPKNCLHGEFIYSTKPLAFVKNIKFKSSLASEKIIRVVSAKDIPSNGQNIGSMTMFGDEPLFGDPIAEFSGQALGVVIAETQRYADMAAKQVKLASQYYFYMETQTALAIPDEDDTMVVYSSSQYPELAQTVIARCLGVPFGNVATAAALCAYKLKCPVKMYLSRNTDMVMVGSRHPIKAHYSVGFMSDGKITGLHLDILIDAGISVDLSPIIPSGVISGLKKYNWGALSFDIKLCKTNNTSKSTMRAPGDTQGSLIAETIIQHVASVLSLDANYVRQKNFHTYDSLVLYFPGSAGEASTYTLHSIFDRLALTSSYLNRVDSIKQFNRFNKWLKRGISCVPLIFGVSPRPAPGRVSVLKDGSILVDVGGIEIGQGLWTKVQQMTAFALGQLWPEGCEGLLDRVRILQADTLNLIQGGVTGGSSSSESSCAATLQACKVLINRLNPVMSKLRLQSGTVSWDNLISEATKENVNLSASVYWVPDKGSNSYLTYGAGISEVEINLFTGAITILRSDLVYDCGKSLNPAVDLGQIEGSFIQGIGFMIYEEHQTNSDGLVVSNSTWDYKIPSVDTIPKQFNVELLNTGYQKNRVLSSKVPLLPASGEPAVVLASSVHCALREAIQAARKDFADSTEQKSFPFTFQLDVPSPMTLVKELCGFDIVEKYLENLLTNEFTNER
ncbi:hypothetical protein PR202_ga30534 [Eleusine coracana subsp. coracana]|uniref:FAD-binding PCMH-type domain-containing protein n=1 Tax=Eleusine coracana subsp. coracana TaxID=191504 RepID=A0AAV5DQ08_ELECO|nr:hypothetical protein PR202_ga30500 [Eleusine coracana subsp. coracana]GJN12270.1 hypothetical protein PR202_ga30534 [Eleusine coracana subsp. coracana]